VRVSILTHSPSFTNSGTCTTAPVDSVAGLVTLLAVSPFTPGSLWAICRVTWAGRDTATGWPFQSTTSTWSPSCKKAFSSPSLSWLTKVCSPDCGSMKTYESASE